MKLVRYGNPGTREAGPHRRGRQAARPEQPWSRTSAPSNWGRWASRRIRKANPAKLPLVRGTPRMGCPVSHVRQVHRHRPELLGPRGRIRHAGPKEPVVFMKATSCIQGPNDNVMLPRGSVKGDWEVELGDRHRHARALRPMSKARSTTWPATAPSATT
jgi:2,4-diketo-3-deoxy-L-fuconate hydrolase